MNQRRIDKIIIEIYTEMYKKSTPKANFKELMKKGITKKENWFEKYYLNWYEQLRIINKICKKYRLNRYMKSRVNREILLGCAPYHVIKW